MKPPENDPVNHLQAEAEPSATLVRAPGFSDPAQRKEEEKEAVKNARAAALAEATRKPDVAKANLRAEAEGGGD